MKRIVFYALGLSFVLSPVVAFTQVRQKPTAAYYITAEEVETVNKTPGVDRTIQVMDIGDQHFAVGIIHRGKTGAPAAAPAAGAARPAAPANPQPACGEAVTTPPADLSSGLYHEKQTEGYYIVSGSGMIVTGGHIVNGRKSAPDAPVTTELNGPSCSGRIGGADVVKRMVKQGDIIIIPAGVPHGWAQIDDHVDYLSFRPSSDILTVGYRHPSIKK
jgi:mannose-6-phosphate isomerase-like protein (cupin superfamily)